MHSKTKKTMKLKNIVRIVLTACAAFTLVIFFTNLAADESRFNRYSKVDQETERSLTEIANYIEFNGLDDTAKRMMQYHSETYTRYSNFIIIDNNFKVLYSLNQGYLDNSGSFYACTGNGFGGNLIYILDAQGNLMSSHYSNQRNETSLHTLSKPLQEKLKKAFEDLNTTITGEAHEGGMTLVEPGGVISFNAYNDAYTVLYDQQSSVDGSHTVEYFGFPTKGMHLFFLQDGINPMREQAEDSYVRIRGIMQVFVAAAVFTGILYWLLLAVWVYLDASQRDNHPALWSVLTLFTNVIGMIVYLVVRPDVNLCHACKEPVETDYLVCPICGAKNREQCAKCSKIVEEEWNICPYCATPVERNTGGEGLAVDAEETPEA